MPAGQPLDPRAPERPTVASLARKMERTQALTDRRIPSNKEPEAAVKHIGPDAPGHRRGRFWLRPRNTETS